MPRPLLYALTLLAGLLHGAVNGATLAQFGTFLSPVGILTALVVVVTLSAALAVALRTGWQRVAVRVPGSWLAAVGLLMCGWLARGSFMTNSPSRR